MGFAALFFPYFHLFYHFGTLCCCNVRSIIFIIQLFCEFCSKTQFCSVFVGLLLLAACVLHSTTFQLSFLLFVFIPPFSLAQLSLFPRSGLLASSFSPYSVLLPLSFSSPSSLRPNPFSLFFCFRNFHCRISPPYFLPSSSLSSSLASLCHLSFCFLCLSPLPPSSCRTIFFYFIISLPSPLFSLACKSFTP